MSKDNLDEKTRAEDIILGGLGFSGEARIVEIILKDTGLKGRGKWEDGEEFEFESEEDLSDLEKWAVNILVMSTKNT